MIDDVAGARRPARAPRSGTYLALAALNRLVAPCSKAAFADWWKTTAADRFTKIRASVLDHRRFWDAMHAVTLEQLEPPRADRAEDDRGLRGGHLRAGAGHDQLRHLHRHRQRQGADRERGKAKQKRADLRLVGLGLVVTRDGGIPLASHAYPGNRPDVTQFADMIDLLTDRYAALADRRRPPARHQEVTVVFDAGQNSGQLRPPGRAGLAYVGSVPPSDCADLLTLPSRRPFRGGRRPVRRADRAEPAARSTAPAAARPCSPTHPHTADRPVPRLRPDPGQGRARNSTELADTLARGKTRRSHSKNSRENYLGFGVFDL